MIPLRLQLKNFLSYGSQVQTIDFASYQLMCLSGKNGHGKSALLDAMTWAVWGQARKIAGTGRAEDGLMRLQQTHMMVSFDFQSNGATYRIRREYTIQGSKAIVNLDFGVLNEQSKQMHSLTDKAIRATQEKIISTIGLDYDSFINSAFLRQGQSNEFSKKTPRERKDILATILGLDRYEVLRKKASEKARALMQEKEVYAKTKEHLERELQQKEQLLQQLAVLNASLAELNERGEQLATQHNTLNAQKKEVELQRHECTRLILTAQQLKENINSQTTLFLTKSSQWRTLFRQQKLLNSIKNGVEERTRLEERIQLLQPRAALYRQLNNNALALKDRLASKKDALSVEHAKRVNELAVVLGGLEVRKAHLAAQREAVMTRVREHHDALAKITQERAKLEAAHAQALAANLSTKHEQEEKLFERRKTYYHKFIAQGNALNKQLAEYNQQQQLLKHTSSAQCPLCSQQLDDTIRASLHSKIERQTSQAKHHISRLARTVQELKAMLIEQHAQLNKLKTQQELLDRQSTRIQELSTQEVTQCATRDAQAKLLSQLYQELNKLHALHTQHKTQQTALLTIDQFVAGDNEYAELLVTYQECEKQSEELRHDEHEYHRALQQLATIAQEQQAHQQFMTDIAAQGQRKREVSELHALIKQLRHELALIETRALAHAYQEQERHLDAQELVLTQEWTHFRAKKEQVLQQTSALEHHKKLLEQKEVVLLETTTRMQELDESGVGYQAIAQALGKDGIQALLIEDAIPEIEQEANNLLSKLTDNQAQLIIESLRDLKSGTTKETLDIKISDQMGIRPYELFSGGEAFRIDFALRVAISKLLARRAGATLQLLIIDEGFGSQDEEGLAHIMDTLYKIQEDFSKIIIVSHLTSMKDQFPVQFVVQKTPQGSTVRVVEQG